MTTTTKPPTLWEVTMDSTKEAVRLYFHPVRLMANWLSNDEEFDGTRNDFEVRLHNLERRMESPFDSLDDLELRFKRLSVESLSRNEPGCLERLNDIEDLLQSAQLAKRRDSTSLPEILDEVRMKIRMMEASLGFEKRLQPWEAKRSRGASGD